jgi:23S rRNA (guanosine2251-2'-O)-methyltransferase
LDNSGIVTGRNAVLELLKTGGRIEKLLVLKGSAEGSIKLIIAEAAKRKIPVVYCEKRKLDELSEGTSHQGVCAYVFDKEYASIDDIISIAKERGEKPLIIVLDGVEDPHNLGAVIRSAECAGVHGIVIPKRRSAILTPTVTKASAGAVFHMAIAKVTNITSAIKEMKEKGLWIFCSDMDENSQPYYKTDFDTPAAIVFGAEGAGVSRLVKENCDFIVNIPMYGKINSLNISAACAVIINEAVRYRKGNSKA